jgi:phage portal protein BeeE
MFGELIRSRGGDVVLEERSSFVPSSWLTQFSFNGNVYASPYGGFQSLNEREAAGNSVVAAAIAVRSLVFSEVRFKFQQFENGRPSGLFGSDALRILERPWPGASTGDLLAIMESDVSVFGNSFWTRKEGRLYRLPADRVLVVTGQKDDGADRAYSHEVLGYLVAPYAVQQPDIDVPVDVQSGGVFFTTSEVAHYRPIVDPANPYRGRSWISTILPDSLADNELTRYKSMYIRNAATPNMAIMFPKEFQPEEIERFKAAMDAKHSGVDKAFKTLYLGGGADVRMLGSNFEQLDMHRTQGGGETRVAVAAGVPATVLGISEGLAGSALNAGNYMAARRRFADGTIRPLWRAACAALEVVVPPPAGTRLWYDDRDVAFLEEDVKDQADIHRSDANTIRTLIDGGFEPSSVVEAVTTGDLSKLTHTGNVSVQLRPTDGSGLTVEE